MTPDNRIQSSCIRLASAINYLAFVAHAMGIRKFFHFSHPRDVLSYKLQRMKTILPHVRMHLLASVRNNYRSFARDRINHQIQSSHVWKEICDNAMYSSVQRIGNLSFLMFPEKYCERYLWENLQKLIKLFYIKFNKVVFARARLVNMI